MLIVLAALGMMAAPRELAIPVSDQSLFLRAKGRGLQRYTCAAAPDAPGGYGWSAPTPDAVLTDEKGSTVARHYAGPTWEATDGSKVVGTLLAKAKSPDGRGVDWLLLKARTTSGAGVFARVSYVRRVATRGGQAPAMTCSVATAGQPVSVVYSATYEFYRPQR